MSRAASFPGLTSTRRICVTALVTGYGSPAGGRFFFLRCLLFWFINEILPLELRYVVHMHQGSERSNCPFPPLTNLFFYMVCKAVIRSSVRTLLNVCGAFS